jgi:hypothetical protein
MSFPVFIRQDNGNFVATLIGAPDVQVAAPTRERALADLQTALHQRMSHGELIFLDLPAQGIMALAGKYRDDPCLTDIRDDIYRERDAEPKE